MSNFPKRTLFKHNLPCWEYFKNIFFLSFYFIFYSLPFRSTYLYVCIILSDINQYFTFSFAINFSLGVIISDINAGTSYNNCLIASFILQIVISQALSGIYFLYNLYIDTYLKPYGIWEKTMLNLMTVLIEFRRPLPLALSMLRKANG